MGAPRYAAFHPQVPRAEGFATGHSLRNPHGKNHFPPTASTLQSKENDTYKEKPSSAIPPVSAITRGILNLSPMSQKSICPAARKFGNNWCNLKSRFPRETKLGACPPLIGADWENV